MLIRQITRAIATPARVAAMSLGMASALLAAPVIALDASPPTIEEVMSRLGYTDEDRAALRSGQIVAADYGRTRDDQLIASVAVFLPVPVAELLAAVRTGDGLRADLGAPSVGALGSVYDAAEWQGLAYGESESREAARLLGFRNGSDFNLAEDEIATLRAKLDGVSRNSGDMPERVSAAYRDILVARYQAYLQRGLVGIADYRHGGTTLEPSAQLAGVTGQAEDFLSTYFPDFWAAFSTYPEIQDPEIVNSHYWLKRQVEGRPAFVLMHEMLAGGEDYALITRREYFVGHTYESLQVVALALPVEGGSAVFYVNSAFTEQITGFFSGVALSVGQDRMRDDLTTFFSKVRAR